MNTITDDIKTFLYKSTTQEFLNSAQNFINLLENENLTLKEFMISCHSILLELYTCGHNFDEIELKYSDVHSRNEVKIKFENRNKSIISKLNENEFYWEVFDPINPDMENEPIKGSLSDDLSDIYHDLKIELEKINTNTNEAIEDAFWQMKFSFRNHWGNHCIDALRALHYLCYETIK